MNQPLNPSFASRRLTPARVALLYAAFSVLWIVASGALLTLSVNDPVLQSEIELSKGVLFVAVTTSLLYLVLKQWHSPLPLLTAPISRKHLNLNKVRWQLLAFVFLAALIPLSGYVVVKVHGPQVEREAFANLQAIAELKTRQIESWLDERYNNGVVIMSTPGLIKKVAVLQQAGGNRVQNELRVMLKAIMSALQYDAALLVDPLGKPLIEIGSFGPMSPQAKALLRKALASDLPLHSEIFTGADGHPRLDIVVPLLLFEKGWRQPAGALILHVSPEHFLFPYLQHWPTASASGESLLVRRDDDSVLYMNELRHRKADGLALRLPLARTDLPAVVAVKKGKSGTTQGNNYRGVPVLAAFQPVGGTDWVVVTKLDRAEVQTPLRDLAFWVSWISLLAISVVCALGLLFWRQRTRALSLELRAESDKLLQQFYDMPFIGIAMSSPTTMQWLKCNDCLCEILGYARAELIGMSWAEMTHPDDLTKNVELLEQVMRGESEGYVLDKRFIRKDGKVVFTSVDVKCVRRLDGSPEYLFATVQDVTERKLAEAKIQRLNRAYAAMNECNEAIVRCSSQAELFPKICNFAVQFGGMKLAWVGLLEPDSLLVRTVASFGEGAAEIRDLRISADAGTSFGRGALGTAIREHRPVWIQDYLADPRTAAWHEHAVRSGWGSVAALPLTRNDVVIGAFALISGEVDAFDEAVRNLLVETAMNISFALNLFARAAERKEAEKQLVLAAKVFEQSAEGIMVTDAEHQILMVNQAFSTITGYSAAEALGRNPDMLASGRHDESFFKELWETVHAAGYWQGEIWKRRKSGEVYPEMISISRVPDADGKVGNYVAIFTDISEHKANQSHIQRLAHFDSLTGLPNRSLLADRVGQALSRVERSGETLALIFLDLDRFKNVNDSLGHRVGDELLILVAQRLKANLRDEDTVSRLGGDEFIMVLPGASTDGAAHVAEKVLKSLAIPYRIEQHDLIITPSLGVAMYPADGDTYETLSMRADTAMYRAKQAGRNTFRFFTKEMQEKSERTLQLENALRRVIESRQLQLHYQPQISLKDNRIIGVEALLRWEHAELGMVPPGDFIPIAEDSGLILPIGEWALRAAVSQMKAWMNDGMAPMVMAVNLSAVQFRHANLPELVSAILSEFQLPPHCLELELTEGVAMDNPQAAIAVMDDLHERGIRMSIDDFGTGYSSLNYLKRFKVYKLKIDQSFVRNLSSDPEDAAIVQTIIGLSRNLGLQTIAEGVETAGQLAFLREKGCDEAQGYYISRPMPAAQFEAFVRDYQPA